MIRRHDDEGAGAKCLSGLSDISDTVAGFQAFNHLAAMVAVIRADGHCVFANAAFEAVLRLSRRSLLGQGLIHAFVDADTVREAISSVLSHEVSAIRFEALLRGPSPWSSETLPVWVIVSQMECDATQGQAVVVEIVEVGQQTRLDREERALDQARANKELVRNLAHEIKNPLGGIRGAAQLLEMEIQPSALTDYTQVIIKEADRLQALVDRLLAPHRKPHIVSKLNIHEVCERVRLLLLAEFPVGLEVRRDYDISIPDFLGDREQLIQATLNIAHNAAQALAERRHKGDALIVLRTRIARQVTLGKRLHRLALELQVEDNGPGISELIRDRIFYPLVSGRNDGTGLGLTLAQTFVQQHQGMIECESEPGLRTVFKIMIPLS